MTSRVWLKLQVHWKKNVEGIILRILLMMAGKMMEKYNVTDLNRPGGGGEYPNQDGFGWTNGVYLALPYLCPPNSLKK